MATQSATFAQALKSPPTYIMFVAVSLMWFFVYLAKDSDNARFAASQAEIRQLRADVSQKNAELTLERQTNKELITSLLVKSGIIDALKNTQSKDSLQTAKEIKQ
jgi:hypothetical protein